MDTTQHLLIVDDDKDICELLSKFLAGQGYRVSVAQDGAAMMQILGTAHIDLVILDIMLPGEDGLSLCRRLRAKGKLPIIMLTAMGAEPDRVAGLEMGADDYLAKPFSPRELLARIRAVLRRATMPPRARRPAAAGSSNSPAGASMWSADSCTRRRTPWSIFAPRSSSSFSLSWSGRTRC
jgi:two-component system OmpR family response regulator